MPSDFISLLSADIDPSSPKSLYSKESVYDLLPKELQLPSVVQQDKPIMSQKSGGEAGPPPPAALASDAAATCAAASSPGGLSGTLPSCPSMLSATSALEQASRLHSGPAAEGMPERMGVEPGSVVAISALDTVGATQSQATPSKRRTVLSISPPPEDLLDDSRMSCQDDVLPNQDSEQSSSMWMDDSVSNFSMGSSNSYNDNTEVPRKSRKRTPRQRPGPKPAAREEAGMDVFDADSAKAPHFVLSQLGSDAKVTPKVSSLEVSNNQKGGILSIQYPQKSEGKELKILIQPETQHRARYLTEGSRGSVKDRTQQGFPTIKLEGVSEPVVLQVFVANDAGRVKPHGFYQACKVTGRNTTACKEVDIEGTTVIEVNLEPTNSMTLAVDCVGILKLRNADVEARIGVAGSKKKSTRARLAFRVNISRPDGSVLTLQALSSPILCTQPAGVPEILKKSLHSGSVAGGEEVFIIGKNFLKGTKVLFQENSTDESGWQAEAEIDMELFHQNHLVVKVPPYHDQTVTSPVSVGIAVVTNAGRTHDLQPFTYTPLTAMQNETSCLNNVLMLPMVKREEPMEVSCNAAPSDIFKPVEALSSTQQILEISTVLPSATKSFPSPVALQPVDSQQPSPQIFTTQETLSTIQKQDIPSPASFQVSLSEDTTVLQPVPPQVPQQFLRETPETLSPEDNSADGSGMVLVGIDSRNPPSQRPQVQALLPQDGVAQLERAVRDLRLGGNETTLTNQLQQQQEQNILENLHHQQQKALVDLQHQQTVLENLQQHQKVLENLQQQALGNIQQQQTHKVLENLQHQQQHQKVMENIQQQSSIQQQHQKNLETLQHQEVIESLKQQLQSELLQTHIPMQCTPSFSNEQQSSTQTNTLSQPPEGFLQNPPQQQLQQQTTLFQQTGGLMTIQTSSFLQQPSSQPSPPLPLFQSHNPLTETQDSQTVLFGTTKSPQVQATLFPGTMTMLTSTNLPTDQQAPSASLFIAQSVLPGQLSSDNNPNQQQQQIAFLTPMQTSGTEAQTVSLFQGQAQLSTPMEQQQSPQQQQMATPQQAPLFPNIATISPNQTQPPTQTGILFCTTAINPHDLPQALLFSGQNQASLASDPQPTPNPPIIFPQASVLSVAQQDSAEPMSFQDQSTVVSDSSASMPSTRKELFQDQQPMQVVPSATSVTPVSPTDQPSGNIFLPQSAISALQGGVSVQELPTTATAATIFSGQSGVAVGGLQNTTSSAPQQPPSQLFQTAIGGTLSQPGLPGQAGLFLFEIPSECGPLMNSPGPSLSDQLVTMGHPGSDQTQLQTSSQIHPLLDQSNNLDDKIDELLERFQEQEKALPRDFLDH
uniref:Nuclear factor of activated T-cells 5 n=1 Tax=Sinocyclocheilus grahami TaxID=75366 RepID=A0A672K4G0_SINGR